MSVLGAAVSHIFLVPTQVQKLRCIIFGLARESSDASLQHRVEPVVSSLILLNGVEELNGVEDPVWMALIRDGAILERLNTLLGQITPHLWQCMQVIGCSKCKSWC